MKMTREGNEEGEWRERMTEVMDKDAGGFAE